MAFLAGDAEPLPWWLKWLLRAERWHCKPWDLYRGRKSEAFWLECDDILQDARAEAQKRRERAQEKEAKQHTRKAKRGRRR